MKQQSRNASMLARPTHPSSICMVTDTSHLAYKPPPKPDIIKMPRQTSQSLGKGTQFNNPNKKHKTSHVLVYNAPQGYLGTNNSSQNPNPMQTAPSSVFRASCNNSTSTQACARAIFHSIHKRKRNNKKRKGINRWWEGHSSSPIHDLYLKEKKSP